jgi:hypothetical protein
VLGLSALWEVASGEDMMTMNSLRLTNDPPDRAPNHSLDSDRISLVTPLRATPLSATPVSTTPLGATPLDATPRLVTPLGANRLTPTSPLQR